MTEKEEVYKDLSAEEIFKILKQKIESFKEFRVTFESNTADLSIHIDYDCKKNRYELNVVKFVNMKIVDIKEGLINIPDERIVGLGHLYTLDTGAKNVALGTNGTLITIFRYHKTLYITGIKP
ncbi:MAG: hypothetical protein QW575_04755 [Thermoproteota archaeon]